MARVKVIPLMAVVSIIMVFGLLTQWQPFTPAMKVEKIDLKAPTVLNECVKIP